VLGSDPLMRLEALGDLRVVVRAGRVVSASGNEPSRRPRPD
jgi:hypothetical protein